MTARRTSQAVISTLSGSTGRPWRPPRCRPSLPGAPLRDASDDGCVRLPAPRPDGSNACVDDRCISWRSLGGCPYWCHAVVDSAGIV